MSSFDYDVDSGTAIAALAIYNAKIVIDPVYGNYSPNPGTLGNGNTLLNVTFNNPLTNIFDIAYLREIIDLIFNGRQINVPRDIDNVTIDPTPQHDHYLGFGPGSEWLNVSTKIDYNCFSAIYNAAVWEVDGATVNSLSMAIPNGTNISLPSNQNTLLDLWSTSPDLSLYNEMGNVYNAGTFSFSRIGGYRVSLCFPVEQLINLQLGGQFEIQFVRNGTDIIRRLRVPVQLGAITLLTSTFVINGTFNFAHLNVSDTYTFVFSNTSLTSFVYNVSSYSLYNLSMEFLG